MSIRLNSLIHRYGSHQSLHGISLHVRRGDCYGFLGHNGAGKTTAMRIALGLMRPSSGSVIVDGIDAFCDPREARARMGGLIEIPGFYLDATGRKNLVELGRLQGLGPKAAKIDAHRVLALTGLEAAADRRVGAYSQGMRQRLGLAQALLGEPDYVLLDEPTNGLDPEGIADLRAVLTRLVRDEDVTVLLSSHQLHEITGLCNRIGVLRQGRLLLEEETDVLLAKSAQRYAIATDQNKKAIQICRELELDAVDAADSATGSSAIPSPPASSAGNLLVDLGSTDPAIVARALVTAGLGLIRFQPEPRTLEEIYLEATHAAPIAESSTPELHRPQHEPSAAAEDDPAPVAKSVPRRAPSRPTTRMLGFELRQIRRRWSVLAALTLAPVLAWRRVGAYRELKDGHIAAVREGSLIETLNGTAFDAVGLALRDSVPVLAVLAVLLGSQVLAADLGRGTLRNVMLRPLRRGQILIGKFLALVTVIAGSYLLTIAVSMWRASSLFGFCDVEELLRGEEPEFLVDAADLWPLVPELIFTLMLPLCALVSIGVLASAVSRRGVRALILALGVFGSLYFVRGIARNGDWEWLLPTAYLPLPPGDRSSYLVYFLEVCFGNDAAAFMASSSVYWVPAAWCLGALALSALILNRRRIP